MKQTSSFVVHGAKKEFRRGRKVVSSCLSLASQASHMEDG